MSSTVVADAPPDASLAAADAAAARRLLAAGFARAGVRRGAVLLAHSSLSSFGRVAGGADTVIDALLDALGPDGALVVPTLSYLFVNAEAPAFDVRATPTNLGAIPAAALRRANAAAAAGATAAPGGGGGGGGSAVGVFARRSLHPTHSCVALSASASAAEAVVGMHGEDRTPVGARSPFARVRELGGQVAFLGCGARCNTSIHGVEEMLAAEPAYLLRPGEVEYVVTDAAGQSEAVRHRRHNFAGTAQRYERVAEALRARGAGGGLSEGRVLAAECVVMEAPEMWAAAKAMLEAEPGCLTETTPAGSEENHHLVSGSEQGTFRYRVGPK